MPLARRNERDTMKSMLTAAVAAASLLAAGAAFASEDLAKSAGCTTCHATDTKKVAASFKDIAKKYKGKADAEATLTKAIVEGKGHPASKAKPDDVAKLVKWVLAM
jgi:cytochrome c